MISGKSQNTTAIVAAAASAGFTVTEAEVDVVLANAVCTTQPPHEWLANNGVVLL